MRRALVSSKGHLDDVTGLVVFHLLQATAVAAAQRQGRGRPLAVSDLLLQPQIEQYEAMVTRERPLQSSDDPLDLGMNLWISHFERDAPWSRELAEDGLDIAGRKFVPSAAVGIDTASNRRRRLAFRDFGACLGIKCYCDGDDSAGGGGGGGDATLVEGADAVVEAWAPFLGEEDDPDLKPITVVMGAAALIPGGKFVFLHFGWRVHLVI